MKEQNTGKMHIGTYGMRIVILLFFAALIIVADIILIFSHGRTFSENENRVLTQAPELSSASLTSGDFMTQEEDFVSDQFFLRDSWISMKLSVDRLIGKKESNGVYLGKDDYLLEMPVEPDYTSLNRNLEAIKTLSANSGINVVMSLVPGAICICDQYAPTNAPVIDELAIIDEIKTNLGSSVAFVDVSENLKAHKTEQLYYKSDHHWTSLGAKYAFDVLAPQLGITEPVSNYAVMTVTDDFTGTMGSNSGAVYVKDSIDIYVPLVGDEAAAKSTAKEKAEASTLEYVVEYVESVEKSATIYKSSALEQKDKYQVFLGGNHSRISIKTNNANGNKLLILKDSYANTFIQFLLPYYETIEIVDPRYYSDDLEKLIDEDGINEILILYSENNFVTDNSLFGVLEDMDWTAEAGEIS